VTGIGLHRAVGIEAVSGLGLQRGDLAAELPEALDRAGRDGLLLWCSIRSYNLYVLDTISPNRRLL
jgi:hypothetical protein